MSISDILIRSISGYIFIVPVILLYFWHLNKSEKKQTTLHVAAVFVFCYYLIGILTMTGIGKLKAFSPIIGVLPLANIIKDSTDIILNIILFIPLGFFLPLLYEEYNRIGNVALTGLLFSLSIEMVQMFGRGATDINDLITNTFGAILGYFICKLIYRLIQKDLLGKFRADKINDRMEVWLFYGVSFIIMITIQPLVISGLFRLG